MTASVSLMRHNVRDLAKKSYKWSPNVKRVVFWSIVAAIVLCVGTVAFAVAGTGTQTGASRIPAVVTDRPSSPTTTTVTPQTSQPAVTPAPAAAAPQPAAGSSAANSTGGGSSSGNTTSKSTPKSGAKPKPKPPAASGSDGDDEPSEKREVVTPRVRDEEEGGEQHSAVTPVGDNQKSTAVVTSTKSSRKTAGFGLRLENRASSH